MDWLLTEEQTITAATVDDLDAHGFRRHLARQGLDLADPQPTLEDDLRNFGAIAEFDGAMHPTLFGLLAFGKQPQAFPATGNFWIHCVAYAGRDQAADLSTAREAKGRLDEQVASANGWARAFGHRERYDGIVREDIPLLPLAAIREAVVNAVAHRDYAVIGSKIQLEVFADRVDITSPGALPNHLTIDAVRRGGRTRTRNEDGELPAGARFHGAARARLSAYAPGDARVQRHGTGADGRPVSAFLYRDLAAWLSPARRAPCSARPASACRRG